MTCVDFFFRLYNIFICVNNHIMRKQSLPNYKKKTEDKYHDRIKKLWKGYWEKKLKSQDERYVRARKQ